MKKNLFSQILVEETGQWVFVDNKDWAVCLDSR